MSIIITNTSMKKYKYLLGVTEASDDETDTKYLEDDGDDTDDDEDKKDDVSKDDNAGDEDTGDEGGDDTDTGGDEEGSDTKPEETESGEEQININAGDTDDSQDSSYLEDDNAENSEETDQQDSNEDNSSDNQDAPDEGGDDAGSGDDNTSDDSTDSGEEGEAGGEDSEQDSAGQDVKIKNITLLNNYIDLYKSIKGAIVKINSVDRNNIIVITVYDQVIKNLTTLSTLVYKYTLYYFEKSSYEVNLYNYRYFVEALRVSIELLKKVCTEKLKD